MADNSRRLDRRSSRLSLDVMRALSAFTDAGNVADAARALGTIQPTMTRMLQVWQKKNLLGATVLERQGRRLQLTEHGRAILPAVRDLVRQYEQLVESCAGRTKATQLVRIGV